MTDTNGSDDSAAQGGEQSDQPVTHAIQGDSKVIGHNTAGSGEIVGVWGEVDSPDGYGLYTPGDTGIEGVLDTIETDFVVEAGTTNTGDARNVVLGHTSNDVLSGSVGAAIGGGGFDNGSNAIPNLVYDDYGTIAGGYNNQAGSDDGDPSTSRFATVGGGIGNSASGPLSTISGGQGNTASSENATVGGGRDNDTSGIQATVGGGESNMASATHATVPGGLDNIASGNYSFAAGRNASADHDGSVVFGDSSSSQMASNHPDRIYFQQNVDIGFRGSNNVNAVSRLWIEGDSSVDDHLIRARDDSSTSFVVQPDGATSIGTPTSAPAAGLLVTGDTDLDGTLDVAGASTLSGDLSVGGASTLNGTVGINQNSPQTQLHVTSSSGTDSSHTGNTAFIEDTVAGNSRGLGIRTANDSTQLSDADQYITFYDVDNNELGAITGNNTGDGVVYDSFGADYAEYMPRRNPEESIEPAEVVGVVGDAVTKRTAEADQALVISDQAVVTGNSPGYEPGDREDYEVAAFIGQVPVKVRGPVEEGALVVPSGAHDGTGRAIEPGAFRPGDGPIVGRAWESDSEEDVTEVTVAVGLETGDAFGKVIADQQESIDQLEAENEHLRERLSRVEHRVDAMAADGTGQSAPADD